MKRTRRLINKRYKKHKKTYKKHSRTNNKTKRGGGYGGNPFCNDPNFSIFNTNLLKLFPYKT
jgi:hypothetical protein